jgi:hypothetical protein
MSCLVRFKHTLLEKYCNEDVGAFYRAGDYHIGKLGDESQLPTAKQRHANHAMHLCSASMGPCLVTHAFVCAFMFERCMRCSGGTHRVNLDNAVFYDRG